MFRKKSIIIVLLLLSLICMFSACKGRDKASGQNQKKPSVEQEDGKNGGTQEELMLPEDKIEDSDTTDKSDSGVQNAGTQNENTSPEDKNDNETTQKPTEEGEEETAPREPIVLPGISLD